MEKKCENCFFFIENGNNKFVGVCTTIKNNFYPNNGNLKQVSCRDTCKDFESNDKYETVQKKTKKGQKWL